MNDRTSPRYALPPAIPTRWLLSILVASLACLWIPRVVHAAPASKRAPAPVESVTAHLDIATPSADAKSVRHARFSLRVTTRGQMAELSTAIDDMSYRVRVRVFPEGATLVTEVEIEAHSHGGAVPFELKARSVGGRGKTVQLGEAGPGGKGGSGTMSATLTLD